MRTDPLYRRRAHIHFTYIQNTCQLHEVHDLCITDRVTKRRVITEPITDGIDLNYGFVFPALPAL